MPVKLQLWGYGLYVYYVVHICDFGMLSVNYLFCHEQVPCHDGKRFYFWCQIFSEDHEGHPKRLVCSCLFECLFVVVFCLFFVVVFFFFFFFFFWGGGIFIFWSDPPPHPLFMTTIDDNQCSFVQGAVKVLSIISSSPVICVCSGHPAQWLLACVYLNKGKGASLDCW